MSEASMKNTGKKVLIVEDEEVQLDLMKALFEGRGYEVAGVPSGEEAVSYLEQNRVDHVITDIRMPGMGGMALIEWVKANRRSLLSRLVVTTGDTFSPSVMEFLKAESLKVLAKPYDVMELLAAL